MILFNSESKMLLSEFNIGSFFYLNGNKWYCTDIGTRVVIAIKVVGDDKSYYDGPPYSAVEVIFDEMDIKECTATSSQHMNRVKTWPTLSVYH
jgi:hypothetical protein